MLAPVKPSLPAGETSTPEEPSSNIAGDVQATVTQATIEEDHEVQIIE